MTETLARSLIRLIVTVAILAAVYFFLVRPILDTTNDTIDKAFEGVNSSLDNAFDDAGLNAPNLSGVGKTDGEKILACVQRVQPDTTKMQKCAERFTN
jgi:type II secretory pathway pseudopilin PulG